MAKFRQVTLDDVPEGTMVYGPGYVPIGFVEKHLHMNGNRPARPCRGINNGKSRFLWKKDALYDDAKKTTVFVRVTP